MFARLLMLLALASLGACERSGELKETDVGDGDADVDADTDADIDADTDADTTDTTSVHDTALVTVTGDSTWASGHSGLHSAQPTADTAVSTAHTGVSATGDTATLSTAHTGLGGSGLPTAHTGRWEPTGLWGPTGLGSASRQAPPKVRGRSFWFSEPKPRQ